MIMFNVELSSQNVLKLAEKLSHPLMIMFDVELGSQRF